MSDKFTPGPFAWPHLDETAANELWTELIEWVAWLRERYALREVRPCWFHHGSMVEELTAAMSAWKATYARTKDTHYSTGPAYWHQQVLAPMLGRFRTSAEFETCTGARCDYQEKPRAVLDDLAEFIAADIANRSTAGSGSGTAAPMPASVDVATMMGYIDQGEAEPEDPADEFSPVVWEGRRWEISDDTGDYHPVN